MSKLGRAAATLSYPVGGVFAGFGVLMETEQSDLPCESLAVRFGGTLLSRRQTRDIEVN